MTWDSSGDEIMGFQERFPDGRWIEPGFFCLCESEKLTLHVFNTIINPYVNPLMSTHNT